MMRNLPLPNGDLLLPALALGLLGLQKGRVVPGVADDRLVVEVQDPGRHIVEEAVVVTDDDDRAPKAAQELLQPPDREDVEVVGGLVEEQRVRCARQHLGQQNPQTEAAGQRGEGVPVDSGGEPEPLEDGRGPRLGGVAVVPLDDVFEFRKPRGVEVLPRIGQDPVPFRHRRP